MSIQNTTCIYDCKNCNKIFIYKSHLERHKKSKIKCVNTNNNDNNDDILETNNDINNKNKFQCDICNKILSSKFSLERHKDICKMKILVDMEKCNKELEIDLLLKEIINKIMIINTSKNKYLITQTEKKNENYL